MSEFSTSLYHIRNLKAYIFISGLGMGSKNGEKSKVGDKNFEKFDSKKVKVLNLPEFFLTFLGVSPRLANCVLRGHSHIT